MNAMPRSRPRAARAALALLALALTGLPPGDASACYWDYDTLAMERRRFPDVLELLSGRFLRHSEGFYRWRVEDRRACLAAETGDEDERRAWTDDLGVALDKLGEHDRAIALMTEALARDPDRYETLANLGTFELHAGRLEEGLEHIRRALEINPDAHFGREIIQQRLVEYVLEIRARRPTGLPLDARDLRSALPILRDPRAYESTALEPRAEFMVSPLFGARGFAAYAEEKGHSREETLKGVLGMMRFGQHTSPILLEALGDVLIWDHQVKRDAKRLAARAYLKASYHAEDPWASMWYRARATLTLVGHRGLSLAQLERSFQAELARGDRYAARIEADEARWREAGDDLDERFTRKYMGRGG